MIRSVNVITGQVTETLTDAPSFSPDAAAALDALFVAAAGVEA